MENRGFGSSGQPDTGRASEQFQRNSASLLGGYAPPHERSSAAPWQRMADRWSSYERPEGFLLHGHTLRAAETWASLHPDDVSDVDRDFLQESRDLEAHTGRRQALSRAINGSLVVAIVVALVGIRLWLGAQDTASHHMRAAEHEALARATAESFAAASQLIQANAQATRTAVEARWLEEKGRARIAEARMLASSSASAVVQDQELAILLALEGVRRTQDLAGCSQPAFVASCGALYRALGHRGWEHYLLNQGGDVVYTPAWASPLGLVVTSLPNEKPIIWDLQTGQPLGTLDSRDAPLPSVSWSHDGARFAALDTTGAITVWDAGSAEKVASIDAGGAFIANAAWSIGDQRILAVDHLGRASAWDAETGCAVQLANLPLHLCPAAWSPDGSRLAAREEDGTLAIWDEATGCRIASLKGSHASVGGFGWGGAGLTIEAWDSAGKPMAWLAGKGEETAWTQASRSPTAWASGLPTIRVGMMTAGKDGHAFFARVDDLMAYACTRVARNLTSDEWVSYFGPDTPFRESCSVGPVSGQPNGSRKQREPSPDASSPSVAPIEMIRESTYAGVTSAPSTVSDETPMP